MIAIKMLLLGVVEVVRVSSGVVFVDDFEDGSIDPQRWATVQNDEGIQLEEANGVFRVWGTSPDSLPAGNPHVGILSQYTIHDNPASVVSIVDFRLAAGLTTPADPNVMDFWVHLCNWSPDRNSTVALSWRWNAWQWWFRVRDQSGQIIWVLPSHSLFGDEETAFRTCQVEHRNGISTGAIWNDVSWDTIGIPMPNAELVNKRLELKSVVYARGHTYDARWDNARIFEHPADRPLLFAVQSSSYSAAILHQGVVVDSGGAASDTISLHLDLRAPIPYDLELRLYDAGNLLGSTMLAADIVQGPYPGDVYDVTSPVAANAAVEARSWSAVKALYR